MRAGFLLLAAFILALLATISAGSYLTRLSYDLLLPIEKIIFGERHKATDSQVVVVGIDEETYRKKPFAATPRVAWTQHIGEVMLAINDANPKVMGFDFIFETTLDQKHLMRGYDKPFLKALYKAGRKGKLVLASVQFGDHVLEPYRMQQVALGGRKNIRLVNITVDQDDVVRSYPASHPLKDGGKVLSLGAELIKRAGGTVPDENFLINFNTASPAIPTYSFVDLWKCAKAGNTEFFAKHFAGKIVMLGATLSTEDRLVPANRFALDDQIIEKSKAQAARCVDKPMPISEMPRNTVPGVYLHAAAINTVLQHGLVTDTPTLIIFAIAALISLFMINLFLKIAPFPGAIAAVFAIIMITAGSVYSLHLLTLPPYLSFVALVLLTFPLTYGYRFVIEDKEKRVIKNAFEHYLAPELIEDLAENPEALKLGGVTKNLSIYFSDIAGFTTISEGMAKEPERLVDLMNKYLTRCTDIIEGHGGYVDKYIGDAVMAIWGAPLDCDDGARKSVEAALDIRKELARFSAEVVEVEFGLSPIGTRMGINTGLAVVGNMGSERRFNYTVTGDTVNLAARLEGANKAFGTDLMIGETTLRAMRRDFKKAGISNEDPRYIVTRRLDRLVVKGKTLPVKVYHVVGQRGDLSPQDLKDISTYHHGIALYYKRRFAEAAEVFKTLTDDEAAEVYIERCEHFMDNPPEEKWDGSFTMTTK